MNILLRCISLSFLTMIFTEACQPGTDRRRYCTFTPEAGMIMHTWLQDRGLSKYFTRENVTVVTNARLGSAGKMSDIDKITMKVPAAVWHKYRNRLLRRSACTIIAQTLSAAGLGAMSGFVGAGSVKWHDFSLTDALHSAGAGAVAMGFYGAAHGVYNVLETAEIQCIDYEEPLKSRAQKVISDTATLNLQGLIQHVCITYKSDCMRIGVDTDQDKLFLEHTEKE